jgi:hypothetical protein
MPYVHASSPVTFPDYLEKVTFHLLVDNLSMYRYTLVRNIAGYICWQTFSIKTAPMGCLGS